MVQQYHRRGVHGVLELLWFLMYLVGFSRKNVDCAYVRPRTNVCPDTCYRTGKHALEIGRNGEVRKKTISRSKTMENETKPHFKISDNHN